MVFHGRHQRLDSFTLGNQILPFVDSYRYLGVVFSTNGRWSRHVDHMIKRSNQRFAACVAWAQREKLHLAWTTRLFKVYVLDVFLFGASLIAADAVALRSLDHQLRKLGRRLLGWPSGSPIAAVFGELGCVMPRRSPCRMRPPCGLGLLRTQALAQLFLSQVRCSIIHSSIFILGRPGYHPLWAREGSLMLHTVAWALAIHTALDVFGCVRMLSLHCALLHTGAFRNLPGKLPA